MTSDQILDHLIAAEGGFVDNPNDRGGCTKYGITLATLRDWRGDSTVDCDAVRDLTEAEAREIYRDRYMERPRLSELPAELQALMVDSAVQHGRRRAIQWLQEAAGTTADGIIGPVTLEVVHDANRRGLYRRVLARRAVFYGEIISNDHSQAVFAEGWMRRLRPFIEEA
jgi:lysozyme family protein